MARLNQQISPYSGPDRTHEGGPAYQRLSPEDALRRSVMSCMLWEGEFYEDGVAIADRIETFAAAVPPETLAALAVELRSKGNLRHAPLLLLATLIKTGAGKPGLVSNAIADTIQRPDEIAELLAIYWRNGKRPLAGQLKKGLEKAFHKFDEHRLAKYNRDGAVKLRDALFLAHAKPKDDAQAAVWKRLVDGTLPVPDTWETALSGGADKKATFERLIREGNLGYLALLRNLRNMVQADCDLDLVREAIVARKNGAQRVLPFRYVAAARACPQLEPTIDTALSEAIADMDPLPGRTIVLVDVSGSMDTALSGKSDLKRIDAAAALAAVIYGDVRMFTFSHEIVEVPPRRGMAGIDAIIRSQPHGGTYLGKAVVAINKLPHDRLIVVTDEQSADAVPAPAAKLAYMINVASARNGVGYGRWTHIDGFSEQVLRWIVEHEKAGST